MYIEKNGFLVVNPIEMSFLTEDRDFSDDLELAELFSSNNSALEAIDQFIDGAKELIVLRCNTTIWLDKDAIQPKKCEKHECDCKGCQDNCDDEHNDISDLEEKIFKTYSL